MQKFDGGVKLDFLDALSPTTIKLLFRLFDLELYKVSSTFLRLHILHIFSLTTNILHLHLLHNTPTIKNSLLFFFCITFVLKINDMKKLLLAIALLTSITCFAQPDAPGSSAADSWGQMFNTSNVYRNTPTVSNLGTQLDSLNTGTIYLNVASLRAGKSNADTFQPNPLNGDGRISFTAYAYHTSTISTVNASARYTLLKANTDILPTMYTPVVGATVFTLTATFASNKITQVPKTCQWDLTAKQGRFWAVQVDILADSITTKSDYLYQKFQQIQLSK